MEKTSLKCRAGALLTAGVLAASMCAPAAAMAADPTESGHGLQDSTQTYNSETPAWADGADGKIKLSYSTVGGAWEDPSGAKHENGSYVLTIPKEIRYENMSLGSVNVSDDYTVNVAGVLEAGKTVTVTADASGSLTNASQASGDASSVSFATTRTKTSWSADDASATNDAGKISGTDATDTIALTGTVKSAGTWAGSVQYQATMS